MDNLKGFIELINYSNQIPVPIKVLADFESDFVDVEVFEGSYIKKYHNHKSGSFAYSLFVLTIDLASQLTLFRIVFFGFFVDAHEWCARGMGANSLTHILQC